MPAPLQRGGHIGIAFSVRPSASCPVCISVTMRSRILKLEYCVQHELQLCTARLFCCCHNFCEKYPFAWQHYSAIYMYIQEHPCPACISATMWARILKLEYGMQHELQLCTATLLFCFHNFCEKHLHFHVDITYLGTSLSGLYLSYYMWPRILKLKYCVQHELQLYIARLFLCFYNFFALTILVKDSSIFRATQHFRIYGYRRILVRAVSQLLCSLGF